MFSLTDAEILQLAKWGTTIEDHYSSKNGRPTPMVDDDSSYNCDADVCILSQDIEWAKDGVSGDLYIVQGRSAQHL